MREKEAENRAIKESSWIWKKLESLQTEEADRRLMTFYSTTANYARSRVRFFEIANAISAWLRDAGIDDGDYVAIDGDLRFESLAMWCACLHLGAIAVFYPRDMRQSTREQYAQQHKIRVVLAQDPQRVKAWLDARESTCKKLKYLLYMDVRGTDEVVIDQLLGWPLPDNILGFEACVERSKYKPREAYVCRSDQPCAVVFTQGKTAGPRPIELSADILRVGALALVDKLGLEAQDSVFYVPNNIYAATLCVFCACLTVGAEFIFRFNASNDDLFALIDQSQPQFLFMLPDELHTLSQAILTNTSHTPLHTKWNKLCVAAGKFRKHNSRTYLNWSKSVIDSLFLRHFKNRLGEKCRGIISFGAPLEFHDAEFFSLLDIAIYNAYALSEAGGFAHIHTFGVGGSYLPTCEPKIQKGMLSIRTFGSQTFESTGDYVVEDERTGLCVRQVETLTLSTGQSVDSLALHDNLVRDPLIEEVLIIGNARPYLTALIYLAEEPLRKWAREQKLFVGNAFSELCQHPKVYAFIKSRVEACSSNRASFEEIRKIALIPVPLAEDPYVLTSAGLVRRAEIEQKYTGIISSFYTEDF